MLLAAKCVIVQPKSAGNYAHLVKQAADDVHPLVAVGVVTVDPLFVLVLLIPLLFVGYLPFQNREILHIEVVSRSIKACLTPDGVGLEVLVVRLVALDSCAAGHAVLGRRLETQDVLCLADVALFFGAPLGLTTLGWWCTRHVCRRGP